MASLDQQQHAVVHAPLQPLLVVAGAGTGKTRTLTHRVAHWLNQDLDANRTMLVTFTQRAASEMKQRLAQLTHGRSLPWVGTFHHLAGRILRDYASQIGYGADFQVADRARCYRMMRTMLGSAPELSELFTPEKLIQLYSYTVNADRPLSAALSKFAQGALVHLDALDSFFVDYLVMKIESNYMDFDDLLLYLHQLLADDSAVADEIRGRFDACFVDEYQDVNTLQVSIIDRLVSSHRRLTVVGDDRQSIYGFRGSDVRALINFESRYPDARVLGLSCNYRCTPEIVDVANASISVNQNQRHQVLRSARKSGPRPELHTFDTSSEQAAYVTAQIKRLNEHGVPWSEQAVLYRTHAQSRSIELALQEAGIPYVIRSGRRLFEKPHIRPLFDLLALFNDGGSPSLWTSSLSLFPGVGPVAINEMQRMIKHHGSFNEYLNSASSGVQTPARLRDSIDSAHRQLKSLSAMFSVSLVEALEHVVAEVAGPWLYRAYSDADQRVRDLQACIDFANRFDSLAELVESAALHTDDVDSDDGVVLTTIHRAKGLEWASVFIVGLSEGVFPLARYDDTTELGEERRLFYVAITRAQRWLYLCHAWQDEMRGTLRSPSRFLDEIDRPIETAEPGARLVNRSENVRP
ncbi:MAG: ATP-dependent helicase [Bradymonadia bacterium]